GPDHPAPEPPLKPVYHILPPGERPGGKLAERIFQEAPRLPGIWRRAAIKAKKCRPLPAGRGRYRRWVLRLGWAGQSPPAGHCSMHWRAARGLRPPARMAKASPRVMSWSEGMGSWYCLASWSRIWLYRALSGRWKVTIRPKRADRLISSWRVSASCRSSPARAVKGSLTRWRRVGVAWTALVPGGQ